MKKIIALTAVAALASLSACNNTPREQAAENIEAAADNTSDALEAAADNTTCAAAEALENQSDAVENMGAAKAEDVRTNDPDTNLANGM